MKLLVMDVEGTVFQTWIRLPDTELDSTIWQGLAHALGPEAEIDEVKTHVWWREGKYASYLEWMKATVAIHERYNLDQNTFSRVVGSARYHPGIEAAIAEAREMGFEPVLVSGGFRELARRAQVDLGIVHAFAACEYFFDDGGRLAGYNLLPCDFEGKLDFIRLLLREYKLGESDWLFVGDGLNDAPIARAAPYAIAFSAHPELRRLSHEEIDSYDELGGALSRGLAAMGETVRDWA